VPYGCKACAGAPLHAPIHINPGLGPRTKYASALQHILGNRLQFAHPYNPHVAAMHLYSIIPGDGVAQ
jgi:hypothetical protein